MAIERVREYFQAYGIEDRIQEFDVSSATVELAAAALHCEPCRIAKTLSFLVGEQPVLIVAAGDVKVDNPKYKAQFGTKAKMLAPDEVEALVGHAIGGVCPFGIRAGVLALIVKAVVSFWKRAEHNVFSWCVMVGAFGWAAILDWNVIALIALCGLAGFVYCLVQRKRGVM